MLVAIGRLYHIRDEQAKARELLSKAYDLSRKVSDRPVRANAACALSTSIALAGEFERAQQMIREALEQSGEGPSVALHRVNCLIQWSIVAREAGDAAGAIEHTRAAERLLRDSRQGSPLRELSVSMEVAESLRMAGRQREAAAEFEAVFARLAALGRDETERAGTVLNNWGLAVLNLGQPRVAERLFRRAIAIGSADGSDRNVSPMLLNNLARALAELRRLTEAASCAERARAKARQAGDEIVVNQTLTVLFNIYLDQHRVGRAEALLAELAARWKRVMPAGHIAFAGLGLYEGLLAMNRGDHQTALAQVDRAVQLAEANPQAEYYLPLFLLRRAEMSLSLRRPGQARADAERLLTLARKTVGPDALASTVGRAHLLLGRARLALRESAEAQDALTSALLHLEPTLGKDHPQTLLARQLRPSAAPRR